MSATPDANLEAMSPDDRRTPLLSVKDLHVQFKTASNQVVQAVSGVSFDLYPGETLGLVGESGCGKSTTGKAILQLPPPTSGSILFEDQDLTSLSREALRRTRTAIQMVFQDPIASLNPRRSAVNIVAEPLATWGRGSRSEQRARARELLEAVGLDADQVGSRRRRAFSGGQCQRISIARALALEPKVLICDEAVSALDVSVQAQILNLLEETKRRFGLTMIFVAHDLAVVKRVSDRVAVMYLGKIVELATSESLYRAPRHHYTRALIDAIPQPEPRTSTELTLIPGEPPSPLDPPSGCRFRTRCPRAETRCAEVEPPLTDDGTGHFVACHFPVELAASANGKRPFESSTTHYVPPIK